MTQAPNGLVLGATRLRPALLEDAAHLVQLRAAASAQGLLSLGAASVEAQRDWLRAYAQRAARGLEHYFVILFNEQIVGAVRIYDIKTAASEFTWGSWVIQAGTPAAVAWSSAILVYDFAFGPLALSRAAFEVVAGNHNVIRFHKIFGATVSVEADAFVHFSLRRDDYALLRPKFLSRLTDLLVSR
ncbi:MAG: GNAT family N-acetyltransferase [bacterium]|nr:GNAT family N-acetyltransferase [bacterium]